MNNDKQLLEKFLLEWPLERVEKMTLREYTNTNKTSFCYWLESMTQDLGSIWGGSSYKFGIFERFDLSKVETRKAYKSDADISWVGKYGNTSEEAFEKIRSIIVDIINYSQKKEFEKIVRLDLGTALKWKIAFMYSDLSLIPIFKEEILQNIAKSRGLKVEKNFYKLQQALLEQKPVGMDMYNYANQLLEENKQNSEDSKKGGNHQANKLVESQRYWLYAPGENAELWEEFYANGIMALGWDELADLNTFPDKASIVKRLQEFYETTGSKKNDATANDEFYNTMTIGDLVFVKKGRTELLGYGVVTSDYYYDSSRERYKHCRKVDWKKKGEWSLDHHLAVKTLTDITKYNSEHPDYKLYSDRLMAVIDGSYTSQQIEKTPVVNHIHPLNQVLFGPPGTGKTYNSINHAVAIVEGMTLATIEIENKANRQEVLRRFQAYVDSGQVVFTTFHQSMSYEDFIEGIKPVEADDQLNYEVQSGLFKTLAESALANYNNAKKGTGKKSFEAVWEQYLTPLSEEVNIPVKMKKSTYKIVQVNHRTIFFDKNSGESKHTLSVRSLKSMYDAGVNQVIKGGLQPYYEALLGQLLKLGAEAGKVELKNYVIIIDEINRGNVAQIFGELITLIEHDKRIGNDEALTVTLPYSKKKGFGIPSNLYIVGTMNTADRSVEALDTALRRRFRFSEMPPRYDLDDLEKKIADISLNTLLSTLNSRLEKLLDKDHLIGHSYFLQVKNTADLSHVFHQNIVPLLQEYFYGDFAKIGLVLGDAFFEKSDETSKTTFARFKHDAIDELKERAVYRLKQEWTEDEFVLAITEMVNP